VPAKPEMRPSHSSSPPQTNPTILSRSEPYVNRVNAKACFGGVRGSSGSRHGEVNLSGARRSQPSQRVNPRGVPTIRSGGATLTTKQCPSQLWPSRIPAAWNGRMLTSVALKSHAAFLAMHPCASTWIEPATDDGICLIIASGGARDAAAGRFGDRRLATASQFEM
jgi:hypothetical protein